MSSMGLFTSSDISTIARAAALAENLTRDYFGLAQDEWERRPYRIFTRKHLGPDPIEESSFARVIRYHTAPRTRKGRPPDGGFGVVLQDPNILRALLREADHDLWTLGLFVMTHELIHIVRFRKFDVDFFASSDSRDSEERLVEGITREILAGVSNTDSLLRMYENSADGCPA